MAGANPYNLDMARPAAWVARHDEIARLDAVDAVGPLGNLRDRLIPSNQIAQCSARGIAVVECDIVRHPRELSTCPAIEIVDDTEHRADAVRTSLDEPLA